MLMPHVCKQTGILTRNHATNTTRNRLEQQLHSMNAVVAQNIVGQKMATILQCETKLATPGLMFR